MLNFDTMTTFDEIRNKYCCFWCLDLDIFHTNLSLFKPWLKFHLPALVKVSSASKTLQIDSIYVKYDIMTNVNELKKNNVVFGV